MVRRRKGFIELEWTCPNCETRNRGSEKTCANCGAPQPEDVQFEAPSEKKFVEEEKAETLRKRGADVHCAFCGTRNPSDAETCSQCGADLSEGVARESGREIDMSARPPEALTCSNCGAENPGSNASCQECGVPLPRPETPAPTPTPASFGIPAAAPTASAREARKKPNWLLIGGIFAGLALCCLAVAFLLFAPSSSVQATVSDVYWQTSVPVQEVQARNYSNERGNPPSDAYNVSCRDESREVCEERTIDRGDGYAEVVEDCRTERSQYCDYTVDEWTTIQTYTLDGHDNFPVYEQPDLAFDQRLGNEKTEYTVTFDTEDGPKRYTPDNVTEFQQFRPGSSWSLRLNALGGVVGVER